jgi:hypothetical protein
LDRNTIRFNTDLLMRFDDFADAFCEFEAILCIDLVFDLMANLELGIVDMKLSARLVMD